MTQWAPEWKVTIQGVEYTDVVLANLSIHQGARISTHRLKPAIAQSISSIFNLAAITAQINDAVSIQVKDTSGAMCQSLAEASWTLP
jgi:hypothetical protein